MNCAIGKTFVKSANLSSVATAGFVLTLAMCGPTLAQVPSMFGAPSFSSDPQAAPSAPAASAPALSAPPSAEPSESGCNADMAKFQQRRNAAVAQINVLVNGGKSKKIDPNAACPKFRNLAAVETQMKNWMIKNKDWCAIPDNVIDDMKAGFAKTPQIANQACNAAAQMKKMQNAQAGGGGGPAAAPSVKLPTGPL